MYLIEISVKANVHQLQGPFSGSIHVQAVSLRDSEEAFLPLNPEILQQVSSQE